MPKTDSTTERAPGGTSGADCSVFLATLHFRDGVKEIAFPSRERLGRFRARHVEITGNDDHMTVREVPYLP